MSRNEPLFDVEDHSSTSLNFQDFGNSTITPDLPSGRISPAATPKSQAQREYYQAEQRFGSTIDGATKSGGVLNLDFYSSWFDVDTLTVLTRCYKTLLPQEDYVNDVLSGVPDLYGPFWIPTTLIFSLFLTSSLISSVNAYLAGIEYTYDFTRLGAATTVVYVYFLGLPVLVWAAIKYWAGASDRSPVEIVSLYGYSSTVWILVAWLSLIPSTTARLLFVFLGTLVSLFFLIRNLYPILSNAPNVSARLLVVIVGFLHLVLAIVLYWSFLEGGSGNLNADKGVPGGVGGGSGNSFGAYVEVCEKTHDEGHKKHWSHELIAGAAAYEAAKKYEDRCKKNGKPESHEKAKELISAFAAAEATKLIETKGLDHLDKAKAEHQAKEQAQKALKDCGDY
ncbi:hypothetical protein JCM16303_004835 [Sporobolomyces ruberrimus]